MRMTAGSMLAVAFALWATPASGDLPIATREQLNAVLWMQTAAEFRGAVLQTSRNAARRLELLGRVPGNRIAGTSATNTHSLEDEVSGEGHI